MSSRHEKISILDDSQFDTWKQYTLDVDRHIVTVDGKGMLEGVEPTTMSVFDFKDQLEKHGVIIKFDEYIHPETLCHVIRGSVLKHQSGIECYFYLEYDHLYRSMVSGVCAGIGYTNDSQLRDTAHPARSFNTMTEEEKDLLLATAKPQ